MKPVFQENAIRYIPDLPELFQRIYPVGQRFSLRKNSDNYTLVFQCTHLDSQGAHCKIIEKRGKPTHYMSMHFNNLIANNSLLIKPTDYIALVSGVKHVEPCTLEFYERYPETDKVTKPSEREYVTKKAKRLGCKPDTIIRATHAYEGGDRILQGLLLHLVHEAGLTPEEIDYETALKLFVKHDSLIQIPYICYAN